MDKKLHDLIESSLKNGSVSDDQRELILDKAILLNEDVDEVENILDEKLKEKLFELIESTVKNGYVSDKQRKLILDKALWLDLDVDEVENILNEKLKLSHSNYNKDAEGIYLKQIENHQTGSNPQSNEELQCLIDLAIADGRITEIERKVVIKKALSMGFDGDEVEVILDGKLSLSLNEKNKNKSIKNKSMKGRIIKCPACGFITNDRKKKCFDCDYEFRKLKESHYTDGLFNWFTQRDNISTYSRTDEMKEDFRGLAKGLFQFRMSKMEFPSFQKWIDKLF